LQQDITQQPSNNKYAVWLILLYVAASIGIVGLALRIFLYRKNPSGEYKTLAPAKESAVNLDETAQSKEKKYYDVHKSAIFFLGGFEVFDREGKKITGEFTPTLKYMLALIILYSLKNSKGISSVKLQELLWFDKSEKSARNNRNVTLSKLRILLNKVGAADINNQNGNWLIELPSDVFCDYAEALHVANRIQGEKITPIEDLYRLLELLENGNMLPNIQYEWLDNFKTDFANLSTETLMYIINNSANDYCNQPAIRLRIADALLNIDSINEEALEIKCKTLVKTGKKGLAKTTFENFNKEYKLLLGEPYNGSLKKYLEG
jgi:two-component SAPR family response regulator